MGVDISRVSGGQVKLLDKKGTKKSLSVQSG